MMEHIRESKWLNILSCPCCWPCCSGLHVRAELDPSQTSWFYHASWRSPAAPSPTRQGLTVANLSQSTVDLRIEGPVAGQAHPGSRKDLSVTLTCLNAPRGKTTREHFNWAGKYQYRQHRHHRPGPGDHYSDGGGSGGAPVPLT